jgi:hypothetical protein
MVKPLAEVVSTMPVEPPGSGPERAPPPPGGVMDELCAAAGAVAAAAEVSAFEEAAQPVSVTSASVIPEAVVSVSLRVFFLGGTPSPNGLADWTVGAVAVSGW